MATFIGVRNGSTYNKVYHPTSLFFHLGDRSVVFSGYSGFVGSFLWVLRFPQQPTKLTIRKIATILWSFLHFNSKYGCFLRSAFNVNVASISCSLFSRYWWVEGTFARFCYRLLLYMLPLDIQLSRGEDWDPINQFTPPPHTFLCLSQRQDMDFQRHLSWSFLCSVN